MNDGLNVLAMDHWGGRSIVDVAAECDSIRRDPTHRFDVEQLLADVQVADQPDQRFSPLK